MNRLWVRLSLMIGGVLFTMFFLQFLSIMVPRLTGTEPAQLEAGLPRESTPEIARRLLDFAALSLFVGLAGGVVIARVVTAPITQLVHTAQRVGAGALDARASVQGSREMAELAAAFNKMAAELQQAERRRNTLMADVSHELRTPLTVLVGNLRAALDHVYDLSPAEIANLHSQTRHLIRLVNDLRELTQAEAHQLPLERQALDLRDIVAETVQALEPLAAEQAVRLADLTTALPPVPGDAGRLRQVLFNLLFNALRHTPAGGEVAVLSQAAAGEVQLVVRDTGAGLAAEDLAAVFDRFYRVDKSRNRDTGGTGLGLAIVKAIVEAHGGRVEARSAGLGRGSEFVVVLPSAGARTPS